MKRREQRKRSKERGYVMQMRLSFRFDASTVTPFQLAISHPTPHKMPHFDPSDDVYASNSHFLSPSASTSARKSPSRQNLKARRSAASLRPSSLAHALDIDDDDAPNGHHHSLAHELALALTPEPSAGLQAARRGIRHRVRRRRGRRRRRGGRSPWASQRSTRPRCRYRCAIICLRDRGVERGRHAVYTIYLPM